MDKALHFLISLVLAYGLLSLLFSRAPDTDVATWRLSAARVIRRRRIIAGAILGTAFVVIIGIWKEWGDSFGLGNVETADVVADLLGIIVGFVSASARLRTTAETRRYNVRLRSTEPGTQGPISRGSRPTGPRLRSRIREMPRQGRPTSSTEKNS